MSQQFEGGYIDQRQSLPAEVGTGSAYNKSYESNTLRSLTILQFKKAVAAAENAQADALMVDNQETNNFCVLGEIMSARSHTDCNVYVIDDSTGEVTVKKYKPRDNESIMRQDQETDDLLEERTWVMAYGHHKPLSSDSLMVALAIRPISDHNEIAYHFAKCIQQHLYFTKGPLNPKAAPKAPTARPSFGPEMSSGSMGQSMVARGAPAEQTDDLFEAIRRLFMTHQEMHINEICKALEDDFGKKKIREAVESMASNGQIYMGSSDDSYVWSG